MCFCFTLLYLVNRVDLLVIMVLTNHATIDNLHIIHVPYKSSIHCLISKFKDTGFMCDRQHVERLTVLNDKAIEGA